MKNQSKIELLVSLNENNVPESIQWNAPEAGQIECCTHSNKMLFNGTRLF